ncbi:MAG TPA: hypothetical protein VFY10_16315 [Dehalococcoidia bacterium]|nr:hypothetical protein [Dehalococcoidia bacterium]
MTTDPWASYRAMLGEAVRRAIADDHLSHAEVLRQQVEADAGFDDLAPLLCLRLADAVCGNPEAALTPATSLALLSQMARVFLSLESQGGAPSLSTAWGMPRVLNAGAAFYALAEDTMLVTHDELPAAKRLRAVDSLDVAVRGYIEALHAASEAEQLSAGQQALIPVAATLAGVYTNADDDTAIHLQRFAESLHGTDAGAIEAGLAELKQALSAQRGSAAHRS